MFTITKQWLDDHKTKRGAYTKSQLKLIGIDWPPAKGWKGIAVGTKIDNSTALAFEDAAKLKKSVLDQCLSLIKKLNKQEREIVAREIERL